MILDLSTALAAKIVDSLFEWRAGPETEETNEILHEIDLTKARMAELQAHVDFLERRRTAVRAAARRGRASWWKKNRQALAVNIVAGIIVGLPFFLLGAILALVLAN